MLNSQNKIANWKIGKDLNKCFTKDEIKMENKRMKDID